MNWKIHFCGLVLITLIQFFVVDVSAWFYLRIVQSSIHDAGTGQAKVFNAGEYEPKFKQFPKVNKGWQNDLREIKEYVYVVVSNKDGKFEENYFTKWGSKERLVYKGSKLIGHYTESNYPKDSIFVLPAIALILFAVMAINFRLRVGGFSMLTGLGAELSPTEKLLGFYCLGTILVTCIIMYVKGF